MADNRKNWAGNYTYHAARFHYPETVEQVQELVASCAKLRVLGSRHSFNSVADTDADMVSLEHLNRAVALDRERHTVTVEGGMKYGHLGQYLHQEGYALHNMGSLPHISVAGACATGTHGSGDSNGNLATGVLALEVVTASGDLVTLSREKNGEQFDGMVIALGGLGVVTKVTLELQPTFSVQQEVYEQLPVPQLEANLDAILSHAYSVSLFTDWRDDHVSQVWLKRRLADANPLAMEPHFYEATLVGSQRHPIAAMPADSCTVQLGDPGPWHERLPHFRMDETPSNGEEIQTEYFVPRDHAAAALQAVAALQPQIESVLMISEIRTIAADTLWMSPCNGRNSVGVHFTWYLDTPGVQQVLPLVEAALAPFAPRPHWGKVFAMPAAQVRALYPKLPDFQDLLRSFDPQGKFRNAFLDAYIFGAE